MSGNDDNNPGATIFNFASRTGHTGFNLTPTGPPADGAPDSQVPVPQAVFGTGNGTAGTRERRSPLQSLNQLPSPGPAMTPVVPTGSPQPGLPDTFRGPGQPDRVGPRMGALSLAAILAVSVAALRGACIALEDWRQRRMDKAAETAPLREARAKHKLAMAQARFGSQEAAAKNAAAADQASAKHAQTMRSIGDKNAKQTKKVPSSSEFGRKTAGGAGAKGGSSGGGKGAGTGPGRGGKAGSGMGPKTGQGRGAGVTGGGAGGGKGRDLKKNSTGKDLNGPKKPQGPKTPDTPGRQKSPMRTSQGAGTDLKKKPGQGRDEPGKGRDLKKQPPGKDAGRTRLPQALKDTAHKAADRRLDNRRKNLDKPAAWKHDPKSGPDSKSKHDLSKDTKTPKPGTDKPSKVDLSKDKASKGKPGDKNSKNDTGTPGRTKLWDAVKNDTKAAANDRWNKRGSHHGVPPLWKNDKKRQKKQPKQEQRKTEKPRTKKPKTAPTGSGTGPKDRWSKARDRVRNARPGRGGWVKDDCFGGTTAPGSGTPAGGATTGTGPGPSTSSGHSTRNTGRRRSPRENASRAGQRRYEPIFRDDEPDPKAKTSAPTGIRRGQDALPAQGPLTLPPAPEPHSPRPGTTRPKEAYRMPPAPVPAQDPRLKQARKQAARTGSNVIRQARHMDARHATEINLDDALDEYGDFKDDGFKTHGQCSKLSGRARKLRDVLEAFAEELATTNNLIGAMFTGAMAGMAESMDLVARMSDEMEVSSLEATEMSETADNDLNDTYRPISQATADAGLTTPSAPIHNQT
ncbi:hypothetical protein ACFQ0X_43700 [Streptomyces rectiviolaceus]|uniref:Uncharacterized protein n=1 Tax=Streptomyces rectiviolaceus TaxID=332591 RepID=A0ABP6NLW2_9ACTN